MSESKRPVTVSFQQFLNYFPEIDPPIILTEEAAHVFSSQNEPFHPQSIRQFIAPFHVNEIDELTEFVPCLKVPGTHGFHAVIYWKAGLLNYEFILMTFTEKGDIIDRRVIAGTFSDGRTLTTSVATIEEDWIIHVVTGQSASDELHAYAASNSKAFNLELLPDGKITNLIDE